MKTKTMTIKADDGDGTMIEVSIRVRDSGSLTRFEVNRIATIATRKIALCLPDLPYTDIGPEKLRFS